MKLNKKLATISFALSFIACSNLAFADGNAFTPLNFDDTAYPGNQTPAATVPTTTSTSKTINTIIPDESSQVGNEGIQNAILQIDNAQVDIRNDLLNYKTKYSEVDAQYQLVKNERKMLHKQIKTTEKRIKCLDKAKENMRKNML